MADLFNNYVVRDKETKEVLFALDTKSGDYIFSDKLEVVKGDVSTHYQDGKLTVKE